MGFTVNLIRDIYHSFKMENTYLTARINRKNIGEFPGLLTDQKKRKYRSFPNPPSS